jgi:hypothetical protein
VASFLFGREFHKAKVQPLLAALNDPTEWPKHLDKVDLL